MTISGTLMHYVQDDLPFGGVGARGFGAYHGIEGFRAFQPSEGRVAMEWRPSAASVWPAHQTGPGLDASVKENTMLRRLPLVIVALLSINCFPYVYHEQNRVLVRGIDVDATLEIARIELEEGGFDATLTVWAIRDQIVTAVHAKTISELYFTYIDKVAAEKDRTTADFGVWHFAWAVSNLYRNGDASIKAELEGAYLDAGKRQERLKNFKDIASEHINGNKIYMGDIHGAARAFARSHIVAPGNKQYLQSLDQYKKNKEKKS